jgi:hypothetical protein
VTPDPYHRAQRLAGSVAFNLAAARNHIHRLGGDDGLARDLDHALLLATALAAGRTRRTAAQRVLDAARADILLSKVTRARLRAFALAEHTSGQWSAGDHLAHACVHARSLACVHEAAVDTAAFWDQVRAGRIRPWAARLAGAAAWLMPGGGRARYRSEFRSELCDIARTGARRRGQLRYAARQLCRAAPLRVAVIIHWRRKATL